MDSYRIVLASSAEREIHHLPDSVQSRVARAIEGLKETPRPPGVKKLRGTNDQWRIRVGAYRVIYRIHDSERLVDVVHIRHRREAYD